VLTVRQLAERLGVSPSTVYSLVEGGLISCYRVGKGRGTIRFTEAHVAEFLRDREVRAGAARPGQRFTHGRN
jgi:excisionase family DNA binding protein